MKPLASRKVARALSRLGFAVVRQKGSPVFFIHPDGRRTTVPRHAEIKLGTIRAICEQIDVDPAQFSDLA